MTSRVPGLGLGLREASVEEDHVRGPVDDVEILVDVDHQSNLFTGSDM